MELATSSLYEPNKERKLVTTSPLFYYSTFCKHSEEILRYISHSTIKDSIHFMNVDNRYNIKGDTYIRIQDKYDVMLPQQIKAVPSLVLPDKGNEVVFGNEIKEYIFNLCKQDQL